MHPRQPLSIAILGTRGVPPRYGGFETFAAELSCRLVARGHSVTVYCRRSLYSGEPSLWHGVRRIELPAIRHKYLETVSHAFLSTVDVLRRSFDVVLVCNAANAFILPLLKAARLPSVINVDGIERRRKKWNALGRIVYLAGEAFSVEFADALVADADVIAAYYLERFGRSSQVIPYGSELVIEGDSQILASLGLRSRGYILYVSRFEPENNALAVVEAYKNVTTEFPLVMVGDAPYAIDYIARIRAVADSRVFFPGALYGVDYVTLQRHAFLYLQATEVGGTHPAMIESMGSGGAVLANDTAENREVGGDSVLYFTLGEGSSLSALVEHCLTHPEEVEALRGPARARAATRYSWARVTDDYESLLQRLTRSRG